MPPLESKGRSSLIRSFRELRPPDKVRAENSSSAGFRLGSPMASRLPRRAADMYRSSRAGETESTSPMLSKPKPESSTGSVEPALISSASKSRMALLYSARFSRWTTGLPGLGLRAALRSSASSSHLTNDDAAAPAGRGMPAGGIWPGRTLRTTFSNTSALPPTWVKSNASSETPPVFISWLWQVVQYWSTRVRAEAAPALDGLAGRVWAKVHGTAPRAIAASAARRNPSKHPPFNSLCSIIYQPGGCMGKAKLSAVSFQLPSASPRPAFLKLIADG